MKRLKKIILIGYCAYFVFPIQLISLLTPKKAEAATVSITSRVNFDTGVKNGTETFSKEGDLKLQASGNWRARAWKTPNLSLGDTSPIASDGNYVYLIPNTDRDLLRYILTENRWQSLSSAPYTAYIGSDMTVMGDNIYVIFGGYQKVFAKYSISKNTWTTLANTPDLMQSGASITNDGTNVYVLRGTATTDFWQYSPSSNVWTPLPNPALSIYTGSDMAYYNGYIYATRGYNTTTFYIYNLSTQTWTTGAVVPGALYDSGNITIKGEYLYVLRGYGNLSFYRYRMGYNTWETITNAPIAPRYVGAIYNSSDDKIYVFRGNSTQDFWKYDVDTATFIGVTDLPNTPGTGADLINHGNYIYYRRGNSSSNFYRLDKTAGTWSAALAAPAVTFADDTKGASAGAYLYYPRGSNTRDFYRYDTGANTWLDLSDPPYNFSAGASVAYPGSGNHLYVTRGGTTLSFYKYDMSSDTWDDAGVADIPDNAEVSYGSRLISDGTDIYLIAGQGNSLILKYTILTNTWSVLGSLPFSPYYGTDISYYQGKIYALAGYYKPDFWEYTISTNSWRRLADVQSYSAYNLGAYNGATIVSNGGGMIYGILGQSYSQIYTYAIESNNYPVSGTWMSQIYDLTYVENWTSLISSATTPGDSSVSLETRTSIDAVTWDEGWVAVDGTTINSHKHRYIQVRATLSATSDRSQTPALSSLVINYAGDVSPPTNPTTITAKSKSVGGATLTSGQSYKHIAPYFTWSGAADSQTSVKGYYVYFGDLEDATPNEVGNFQTSTSYLVNKPLTTGNYYLRIQTVDLADNLSATETKFVYSYNGITTTNNASAATSNDFSLGTVDAISTASGRIQLASRSAFWLEERLSLTPATISDGGSVAYVASTNKLYVLRGSNTTGFYEYDIATDVWTTKAVTPAAVYRGGQIIEGPSGYLYAFRGEQLATFWRYDIAANTWSDVAAVDAPQALYYGSSMTYDGNRYIYALKGNSDDTFMRYDTETDTWDILANTDFGAPNDRINNSVYAGGDLAYDGSGTVYAIQGNTYNGFSSYDVQSNSWTVLSNLPAQAYTGASIAYDSASSAVYYFPGWGKHFFYRYNISTQEWERITDAPATLSNGAEMRNVNGSLYVLRGASTQGFYKYNISKSSWLVPTQGLFGGLYRGSDYRTFNYGADIEKGDGNNFYIIRGNYDNLFTRYNSVSGETTKLADAPAGFYGGADLVYESTNNKIYATANSTFRKLLVYDIATDVWAEEALDPPPFDVGYGTSMVYDGSRYIYWSRANGSVNFQRFDTQAVAGSKWSALTNVPASVSYGSEMVLRGNYIYLTRGNNQLGFYRYDIGANTWNDAIVADLPTGATIYNDGFLVDPGGDYLYACRGANTATCYRYSVPQNSWSQIANAPANIYYGGSAASNGSDKIFVIAGQGSNNTFTNGLHTLVLQTETSGFQQTGTYTSKVYDLGTIYKFTNISLNYIASSGGSLMVETRVSDDNSDWSSWSEASEQKVIGQSYSYKISSNVKRYLQVRFTLSSSDGVNSGYIDDYSVNYYQDSQKPVNPTSLSSYSNISHSTAITTNVWNNFVEPSFTWPTDEEVGGASDTATGSGVVGYYVYFGTDSQVIPSASESRFQTAVSYTASNLITGTTYYLRIQTKDDAGSISEDVWQPFIYKFDNVAPTNPGTVTVDPSYYTAVNNFTFAWSGATDSASGIKDYCYKLGSTGSETCGITTASISGEFAYQTGTNVFYLRVRDNGGNAAASYVPISFYYSSTAPGAPTDLKVMPASNVVNEFAFSWDPPEEYYGAQSNLRYYYSINAKPTNKNVNQTGLANSYLASDAYATQSGTNIFYVIAKDEAGNIDYNNYASVEFTADTSAPGIPTKVNIADMSDKLTSEWKLVLTWSTPVSTGSGISVYKVYHSTTEGADCTNNFGDFVYDRLISTSSAVFVDLTQETHYYCVKACDSTSNCSAVSSTVSMFPDGKWPVAPEMIASPSAVVRTKSAIVSWSTSRAASSFVKYGKSADNYDQEVGSSSQVAAHEINIIGLDPGTTYHYKVLFTDEDGNTGESSDLEFTTNPAPFISSVKVTSVSLYSAYINFTVKNSEQVNMKYGKTLSYGGIKSMATSTTESTYSFLLDALAEGTLYHLQLEAEDEEGNLFTGDDYSFKTLPVPKLNNVSIQQVVGMSTATLRVSWLSNTQISSIITYYPSANPALARDQISLIPQTKHEMILKDLNDSTEYTVIIKGKDKANNEAKSAPQTVKTAVDFRAPEILNMSVESTIIGIGDEAKAQIVISWDTDEPGTSQVQYAEGTGTSYSQSTQEDTSLTSNHIVTLTGLSPARIYHLQALSKDKSGNAGQSYDNVVVTPKATKAALDLVINNLTSTFGFLNGLPFFK